MISIFVNRSIPVAKTGLILFALTALLIAGASSVMRLHLSSMIEANNSVHVEQVSINPDPVDISTESENMNPGNPPNGEPSATFSQFIISGGLTHDQARLKLSCLISPIIAQPNQSQITDQPIGSIAKVNSLLGRQFTLVGAKPDGTS